MDTILYMKKSLYSVCFSLLRTDVAWDNIVFLCQVIALAYFLGEMAPVTAILDSIYLRLGAMDNALLRESRHSPEDKIEERITFASSHARLYLFKSDDEQDENYDTANTFDISCGGGRSRSS